MAAQFSGSLNPNEIFSSIYNMIISQDIMVPELSDNYNQLVNRFRVDGSMYGDSRIFYAIDVLKSRKWLGDAEASNLLNVNRPADPKCQVITLDQFRQIDITVDNYLTKRAWSTEGVFSQFNSIILGMLSETKKIYDVTLFNTYVGTTEADSTKAIGSLVEIPLSDITATGEEKNRLEAQMIATAIADLKVSLKDFSRDFNEYGFMRSYSDSDIIMIVNSKYANRITKMDLPTIFHKDGLSLVENVLPAKYFGVVCDSSMVTEGGALEGNKVSSNAVVRSLVEKDYIVSGVSYHVFPGEKLVINTTVGGSSANFLYAEAYVEKDDIICKIVTGKTFKYMSGFETSTEFFNPRALNSNHYLTWGYANPDRLLDQPLITVHAD